jgi:ABC-2 type transport system ATP-binding protein
MLLVQGLTKRYGSLLALDDVSFSVERGQIVGFLGPNGAGKTTAMRAIMRLVALDAGDVTWAANSSITTSASASGTCPPNGACTRG